MRSYRNSGRRAAHIIVSICIVSFFFFPFPEIFPSNSAGGSDISNVEPKASRAYADIDGVVNLAIIWHQHQPLYKDATTEKYVLPWARVHGVQEYIDSPKILEQYPDIKVTFNLVPSLLWQLNDYATNGSVVDRHLELVKMPEADMDAATRQELINEFFRISPRAYEGSDPAAQRYDALHTAWENGESATFTNQDILDLKFLYHYFQFSEPYISGAFNASERIQPLLDLKAKGSGYTQTDVDTVIQYQRDVLQQVIPIYKAVIESGQADLITSPFYHPILPALMLDNWTLDSGITVKKGVWERDTRAQLERASAYFKTQFNVTPIGLWPSEEAVGEAIIEPVADAGFEWMVSDEWVLRESGYDINDKNVLYHPYQVESNGKNLTMVFRDRFISDAIAFTYGNMQTAAAVEDFMDYLYNHAKDLEDINNSLITIALDGENWMFMAGYPNNGRDFLAGIYQAISDNSSWIRTVTIPEFIATHPPTTTTMTTTTIGTLHTGSWIDANLNTWMGETDEDLAWKRLDTVRDDLLAWEAAHPNENETLAKAWESLYAAEGSDWFWWYGKDQDSGNDAQFDYLFKQHLTAVYKSIGVAAEAIPTFLRASWSAPATPTRQATNMSTITMDGKIDGSEWDTAAWYTDAADTGLAMDITGVGVGYDSRNLFLVLDATKDLFSYAKGNDNYDQALELEIYISSPNPTDMNVPGTAFEPRVSNGLFGFGAQWCIRILFFESYASSVEYALFKSDMNGAWLYQNKYTDALLDSVAELVVPLNRIEAASGDTLRLTALVANKDTKETYDFVPEKPIEILVPRVLANIVPIFETDDPLGDETGDGDYVYPTNIAFSPGHGLWDITHFWLGETDFDVIFKIAFAEMTDVWSAPGGYSHQIVQIYVDKDNVSGNGRVTMLDGAYAEVTPDYAWEVVVSAIGWETYLKTYDDNKKITQNIESSAELDKKTVTIIVAKSIFGEEPEKYGYIVVVGSQDGYGPGNWRNVASTPADWVLGGGLDSTLDPNVIDMVLPASVDQAAMIGSYDIGSSTPAKLSGIRIPTGGGPGPGPGPGENHAPELLNVSITPGSGYNDTVFVFEVLYKDSDGDPPVAIMVRINGTEYALMYVSGSNTTGALYRYQTTLVKGQYSIRFDANDGEKSNTTSDRSLSVQERTTDGTGDGTDKEKEAGGQLSPTWTVLIIVMVIILVVLIVVFIILKRR